MAEQRRRDRSTARADEDGQLRLPLSAEGRRQDRRDEDDDDIKELEADDDVLPDDFGDEEQSEEDKRRPALAPSAEPLFAALLRDAVGKLWRDDAVLGDFVDYVAGPLSEHLGTHAAKGGDFLREREAAGLRVEARYAHDQSMRAHLVNGLFPVLNVARALQSWGAPRLRLLDDRARRGFIAGYILHDWLKLPGVEETLQAAGLRHNKVNVSQHLPLIEDIFRHWCLQLGLDRFLESAGGSEAMLHDLIFIACNTQVRWGTARNVSTLPRLSLNGRTLDLCESLSRLADLVTYVAPTPRLMTSHEGIRREIMELSNNTVRLAYHHVADNRGILTNLIHNAALELLQDDRRVPFLYAPSGVVYLERNDAPPRPPVATMADAIIRRVQQVSGQRLSQSLTGFKRDGKGLKRADYYGLFFNAGQQVELAARAAGKLIAGKAPSAGKRFAKMRDGRWLPNAVDLDLPEDIRVDQLAEWCFFAEGLLKAAQPELDVTGILLHELGLDDLRDSFDAMPRDNRAGGVGYHWYFAAGHYLKRHPGRDPAEWQRLLDQLAGRLAAQADGQRDAAAGSSPDWPELRAYIEQTVSSGPAGPAGAARATRFADELARYGNAKRTGKGRTSVCSLCSSPFEPEKQQEAASLFAPQVYSNKLPLHGSTAIRDICPICGLEMMLRQILMNRSNASGGRFEGRNIRYLYFYPTYFFSPETLEVFRTLYYRLQRISFTELRRLVTGGNGSDADALLLDAGTLQRLEALLLTPEDLNGSETDRYARMHFPENEPVTFYFVGIPPAGRDARDAESWVQPAFLSLLLPVCLDVKVVASSSPLPLLREASELPETVLLDGAHAYVRAMVGQERINVDHILPSLQRLTVGYLIHVDANSRMGRGGFDYRWSEIPPLARDLAADAAYACFYLKKWQRNTRTDTLPTGKVRQYIRYLDCLMQERGREEQTMSHAGELVQLSRQFYRAGRYNSNSILRPIAVAARAVLAADPRLFDDRESLIEAVRGELHAFMDRVRGGNADGRVSPRLAGEDPAAAARRRDEYLNQFAAYFVGTIFYDTFRRDVAALRGRQLNLLRNAYEVVYLEADARERQARAAAGRAIEEADEPGEDDPE